MLYECTYTSSLVHHLETRILLPNRWSVEMKMPISYIGVVTRFVVQSCNKTTHNNQHSIMFLTYRKDIIITFIHICSDGFLQIQYLRRGSGSGGGVNTKGECKGYVQGVCDNVSSTLHDESIYTYICTEGLFGLV